MDTILGILEELGVSESARAVYVSLLQDGEATARMLAERTGITRTSVYDQVRALRDQGLVVERDIDGTTYFGTGDVRRVSNLLADHIERLEMGKQLLDKNLAELVAQSRSVQPKVRFFEGKEGVQQMLRDMLWHEKTTVLMCWPYGHMLDTLGADYLRQFNTRRIREHITLHTIWTHSERGKKEHVFKKADTLVKRRYAAKGQTFRMSYAIYDNSVAFVSSSKEAYGFVVQSEEFAELMSVQFAALWATSSS